MYWWEDEQPDHTLSFGRGCLDAQHICQECLYEVADAGVVPPNRCLVRVDDEIGYESSTELAYQEREAVITRYQDDVLTFRNAAICAIRG